MDTSDDDVLNEDIDIAIGENLEEGSIIFVRLQNSTLTYSLFQFHQLLNPQLFSFFSV